MNLEIKNKFSNGALMHPSEAPYSINDNFSFYLSSNRKLLFHTAATLRDKNNFILPHILSGITSNAKMKELFLYSCTVVKVIGAKPKNNKNRVFYIAKGFLADPMGNLIVSYQDGRKVEGITMYVSNRLREYPTLYKWISDLSVNFDGQIILKKSIDELTHPKIQYPMGKTIAETKDLKSQFLSHAINEYRRNFTV